MAGWLTRRDLGRLVSLTGAATTVATRARAAVRTWQTTGHSLPGLGGFDIAVMAFMQERGIPCGSLAVAREGRLLLARGYTWSAGTVPATSPTSLFRTASVTKPITAAAVLHLTQNGRISLSDRVAPVLGLDTGADPRLGDVTVLHLLQHLGGWDRSVSTDPMFDDAAIATALGRRLPVGHGDIIRFMGRRGLDHAPGTAFAYSNYGYLLLGLLVQKVAGVPYERYVRENVLAPAGVVRMRLGRTLVRSPGEVPYFSQYRGATVMDPSGAQAPAPYGTFNQENNAFNCGWLASAVDLVRFVRVYDGTTPVLSRGSAALAFAPPSLGRGPRGRYYGCGWHVRPGSAFHPGSLPGTHTLLVRRTDGVVWAVMFDQRDDPSGERYRDIDSALRETADDVETWPAGDLDAVQHRPLATG
ncbi:serine hydrolase domain-containing protein [Actinomadura sp. DC4]|uniref:serine hydrolase domain-containing protein n=1 Tax=Actinomadura sp. DC4 TaxID=3055069 RepID=UPI0025B0C699|nr:serine hydrolase domain-containing protein [Actinomadura sp. DC4]MDN3351980.1 serine hydrolase domain-containing protein [Actinomadura sp. DC4]